MSVDHPLNPLVVGRCWIEKQPYQHHSSTPHRRAPGPEDSMKISGSGSTTTSFVSKEKNSRSVQSFARVRSLVFFLSHTRANHSPLARLAPPVARTLQLYQLGGAEFRLLFGVLVAIQRTLLAVAALGVLAVSSAQGGHGSCRCFHGRSLVQAVPGFGTIV